MAAMNSMRTLLKRGVATQVPQGVRAMSSLKEILRQQVPIKQAELK
eukprot:CAMPEP_0119494894 /NCGR_PEP_ID=MMETSP1344-20130328/18708_1 /TAXON_ID=236787 /ORGANISM="Florenciella parvula, Strain CCMP2471" /LENGTH=45 /DNA_ID= /DNA_START= /DNA_END= /DNA_ORIENTATION=